MLKIAINPISSNSTAVISVIEMGYDNSPWTSLCSTIICRSARNSLMNLMIHNSHHEHPNAQ
jgi:hypothetical protein